MSYKIVEMNERYAKEIISWQYEGILSIYNLDNTVDTLNELLTKEFYAVISHQNRLEGFFCIGEAAIVPLGHQFQVYNDDSYIDVGLGMKPDNVGKHKGLAFVEFGLKHFRKKFNTNKFRLTVLDFNTQAIQVYHNAGFKIVNYFETPEENYFLIMVLED